MSIVVDSAQYIDRVASKRDGLYAKDDKEDDWTPVREHPGLQKLLEQTPLKLNLWCRTIPVEGYVNVGTTLQCDVIGDIRDLQWVPDGVVDEILAINAVQHFYRDNTLMTFKEWARTLKGGGVLRVEAPDLGKLCEAVAEAVKRNDDMAIYDTSPPLIWGIDGAQVAQDALSETNRNGLTVTRCKMLLEYAGFCDVKEVEPFSDATFLPFALEARKRIIELA